MTIDDIAQAEAEIKGLKSFSIYEIEIYCTNKCGQSGSVKVTRVVLSLCLALTPICSF